MGARKVAPGSISVMFGGAAGHYCGIFGVERPPEDSGHAMPEVI